MKRKASLLLIASVVALGGCSWSDLMFWKKWGKKDQPAEKSEEEQKQDVIAAFNKLTTLDSFTSATSAKMGGENEITVGSKKVPSYQTLAIDYVSKKVGNNTKTNSKISSTTVVNLKTADEIEGVTKEETMSALVLNRNMYLQMGYESSLAFDMTKQEAVFVSSLSESETFTIYDEDAKQTFDYSVGDEHVRYNYDKSGSGIIDTDDLIEVINKGTVNGDTIHAVIDGDSVDIKFELKDGYVTKLEAEVEGTQLKITYSDFNKTSFDIPSSCHKPVCRWPHDSNTAYYYTKTESGHRKYCQECHLFLGEEKAHVHAHNDKGFCEICGYVDGEDDVESSIVQGFENAEGDAYLKAKAVGEVIISTSTNYNYDYTAYSYDSVAGTSVNYRVYATKGVVFTETTFNTSKLEGACVETSNKNFALYKGLSQSELESYKELSSSERSEALKTYLYEKTVSATYIGKEYRVSHALTSLNEVTLDEHHNISNYVCNDCGEITSGYISESVTDHEAGFVETQEVIDQCHTLVKHDCPTCHEHKEEIKTSHVEGEHDVQEITIDSCHKLRIEKCATCGEILSRTVIATHTGHTSTRTIDDGNGGTKTITSCDDCHLVLSIA